MVAPIHPPGTFAPLRAMSEAGMRHTARRWESVTTRYPNDEETTELVLTAPFECRLKAIGAALAQIAAAQGVKAQWSFVCPLSEDVAIGQRVQVSGETDGVAWTREIVITMDKGLTGQVHRETAAIDVGLNQ
jgi:hypothetical protein